MPGLRHVVAPAAAQRIERRVPDVSGMLDNPQCLTATTESVNFTAWSLLEILAEKDFAFENSTAFAATLDTLFMVSGFAKENALKRSIDFDCSEEWVY